MIIKHTILLFFVLLISNFGMAQKAAFTSDVISGCGPLMVSFDGTASEGDDLLYSWDFGNGNISEGKDKNKVGAVYTTPGRYSVKLTVKNSSGTNIALKDNYVTVFPKPSTNFELSGSATGCLPHQAIFKDLTTTSVNGLKTWTWDFGDGESSSESNPVHTYKSPGSFSVSLITIDNNGCTNSITKKDIIKVSAPAKALFSSDQAGISKCKLPVVITFRNDSKTNEGVNPRYEWNFGDGTTSTEASPKHTFNKSGSFDVSLIVKTDVPQCNDTIRTKSAVNIANYAVDFTSTKEGCNPATVKFQNNSSITSPEVTFLWNFGDSTTSSEVNPTHIYTKAGNYHVSLKMIVLHSDCSPPAVVKNNHVVVNNPGTIDFSASSMGGCVVPFSTKFSDLSSSGSSWSWDFGDGNKSSERNPAHTYEKAGNYAVKLIVTEANGCVKTLQKPNYIQIGNPVASFTVSAPVGCIPFNAAFVDNTKFSDPVVSRLWTFGDGKSSTEANPSHEYTQEGRYDVKLKVKTSSGCEAVSAIKVISAGTKPKAEFDTTGLPLKGCKPLTFTFKNLSNNYDSLWLQPEVKAVGGKESSIVISPNTPEYKHVFTVPGVHSPHLVAFKNGCRQVFSYPNSIELLPPKAVISYSFPSCNSSNVRFLDKSIEADRVLWKFGTGHPNDTSTSRNPVFKYKKPGNYKVILTAYYERPPYICQDTTSVNIYIPDFSGTDVDFTADKTEGCAPFQPKFSAAIKYADTTFKVNKITWILGNGQGGNQANAQTTYTNPGSYDVMLVVHNSRGCIDTIKKAGFIKVSKPSANFLTPSDGCFPYELSTSDSSIAFFPIVKREWTIDSTNFSSGNDLNINYLYDKIDPLISQQRIGTKVNLKITDKAGCVDSVSKTIRITKPVIKYSSEVASTCDGDTINFRLDMGDSSGIGPFTAEWAINDSVYNGTSIKHFFGKGEQTSYLKVSDRYNCTDSVNILSEVSLLRPQADFTSNTTLITCWPGQVMFKDSSSLGKVGIKNWVWTFGDSTYAQVKNPSHIYTSSGIYDVQLVVEDSIGCIDTIIKSDFITIKGPVGTYEVDTAYGYVPLKVNFQGEATNATNYLWDFGDGVLGSEEETEHVYEKPGIYYTKMIIEDDFGCKNVYEYDTIHVVPCAPRQQKVDTSICYGSSIKLQAGYTNAVHEWVSLQDSNSYIITDTSGLYVVKMTLPDMPCFAYDTFNVNVIDLRFELGNDTAVCFGQIVPIKSNLPEDHKFLWNNGIQNPDIIVTETGFYSLEVSDQNDICYKNDSVYVEVLPLVMANAGSDIVACFGDSVKVNANGGTIFNWTNGNKKGEFYFKALKNITYGLTVTDSLHCSESTDEINIIVNPLPVSNLPEEVIHCFESGSYLLSGEESLLYEMQPGRRKNNAFEVDEEGLYYVKVYNEYSCSVRDSIYVRDICEPRLFVPSAFSPNGDGANDNLEIFGAHFVNFEITIFNKWGEVIFKSFNPEDQWNGEYRGEIVPAGVYPYFIQYESMLPEGDKLRKTEGSIVIKR